MQPIIHIISHNPIKISINFNSPKFDIVNKCKSFLTEKSIKFTETTVKERVLHIFYINKLTIDTLEVVRQFLLDHNSTTITVDTSDLNFGVLAVGHQPIAGFAKNNKKKKQPK